MKACGSCKEDKELTEFFKDKKRKDGLYPICKACHQAKTKAWRQKDPKKNKEIQRSYYERTVPNKMLATAKKNAKAKGILFNLDITDIVIPKVCPVFGTSFEVGKGKPLDTSASLDKYIPSLGYVKGNVNVISHKANAMKNTGSIDDVRALLTWMEQQEN